MNDAGWLLPRLKEAAAGEGEQDERLAAIARLVNWTDPGPGGYYDDLGDAARQPHFERGLPFARDPQRLNSAATGFGYRADWRLSWMTHAETFWDTPLRMHYSGLDPAARTAFESCTPAMRSVLPRRSGWWPTMNTKFIRR